MKKVLIFAAAIAILITGAFLVFGRNSSGPEFRTGKVTRGEIESAVTATGTVNPVTTVLVGTQVSGRISDIYVDFNSVVKKGQLIAEIDPATFEAQVEQARANLLSAQANLEKSDASLADASRTLQRNRELLSKNLIAKSDYDTSETNYETAKAQVGVSKAQVAQTEAALKASGTNLRYTKILSPVNGVVISRSVDVGQTVAASFQTPTLFTIAEDLTKMQVNASVDEADIGKIKVGQEVDFTVDAYPETVFRGRVGQIRNAPITVQNVVTYDVIVEVSNAGLKLKPGMTANISIIVARSQNALRIPNAALRFRPTDRQEGGKSRQKGPGIWVLENGKPRRVAITAGISDGNFTEVVSGDLKEGQAVITEALGKAQQTRGRMGHGPRIF